MKPLERETIAERFPRLLAQFQNSEFADHVRAGLAGIDDVPFYFTRFDSVVDRLPACPVFEVDAGIHHQTPSAEQFLVQSDSI